MSDAAPSCCTGRSAIDGREHERGFGQVRQHGMGACRGKFRRGKAAGGDAYRACSCRQGGLDVERRVADERGRQTLKVRSVRLAGGLPGHGHKLCPYLMDVPTSIDGGRD